MHWLIVIGVAWGAVFGPLAPVGTLGLELENSALRVGTLGLELEESRAVGSLFLELEGAPVRPGSLSLELEDAPVRPGSLFLELEDSPRRSTGSLSLELE